MILGTFISAIVLFMGWPRRKVLGGLFFVWFSVCVTGWLIASTIESFVVEQSTKILWSQISYIFFVQVNPVLFLFVVTYTLQRKVSLRLVLAVLIIPAVTLVVAWTNSWHHWLWSSYSQGDVKNNVLIYHHGFWFWIHTSYLYILMVIALILIIKAFHHANRFFRAQLWIILGGMFFPLASGTVYALGLVPIEGLDITPTGLVFTGLFLVWGLLRFQLLDLLPVARTTLIEQLQDSVVVLDMHGHIADINWATQKLLGWNPREILGRDFFEFYPEMREVLSSSNRPIRREVPLSDSPGIVLEIQCSSLFNQKKDEVGKLIVVRDVTSRNRAEVALQSANQQLKEQLAKNKQLHKKLEQQALHDSLTGLYNRHIDEILTKEFSRAHREKTPISVAMIDIDHFKSINDRYGHQYGDLLLKTFSQYLLNTIRVEDYAARYGGDEILLAFPGMDQENAVKKAEEIRENFTKLPILSEFDKAPTTITVGIATYPQNGKNLEEIIRAADWALYSAKEEGRNRVKAMG